MLVADKIKTSIPLLILEILTNNIFVVDLVPVIEPKTDVDIFGSATTNFTNYSEVVRIGKVLNFFPIPVEEECLATDGRRKGICMNTYECRIQTGASFGSCALGFGVCCVFKVTCHQDVFNNITYFVNPQFPDLTQQISSCPLKIKKLDPEIAQIRLDFIHFTLGQPNRRTGDCEDDIFEMSTGSKVLQICGINSGQHVYFDVDDSNNAININMTMSGKMINRIWEIKITQIPFVHRAPPNCLQYFTESAGIIQTMNFAENGRHLANQDYNICMRQEEGMCSIVYEPCDENSFQIGPNAPINNNLVNTNVVLNGYGNGVGQPGQGIGSTVGSMGNNSGIDTIIPEPSSPVSVVANSVDESSLGDVGSGDGASLSQSTSVAVQKRMMEFCVDRIMLPCDDNEFLMTMESSSFALGFCDLVRCGNSLCPHGDSPCQVESSVTPFMVGVHFGPSAREQSPEENIGMCLTYKQQPCIV